MYVTEESRWLKIGRRCRQQRQTRRLQMKTYILNWTNILNKRLWMTSSGFCTGFIALLMAARHFSCLKYHLDISFTFPYHRHCVMIYHILYQQCWFSTNKDRILCYISPFMNFIVWIQVRPGLIKRRVLSYQLDRLLSASSHNFLCWSRCQCHPMPSVPFSHSPERLQTWSVRGNIKRIIHKTSHIFLNTVAEAVRYDNIMRKKGKMTAISIKKFPCFEK